MQQPPPEGADGAGSERRSDAQKIGASAANRLHSEVDARKGTAATEAKLVSSAMQRAAGELDEGAPQWIRSAFQQGADQIQRFAQTLEQRDSREILREVQSFARERPGIFLGACAAAGFAAARLLKAGAEQESREQFGQTGTYGESQSVDQGQPWGGGERTGGFGESPPQTTGNPAVEKLDRTEPSPRGEFV